MSTSILLWICLLTCALTACEQKPSITSGPAKTAATPTATDTPAPVPISPKAAGYAGTYVMRDTATCSLSITIEAQSEQYVFTSGQKRGTVQVTREGADTYLTFVGLKEAEPDATISAAWQDSVLLIQNHGNSMNEYTHFGHCDAKYLELVRLR